MPRRQATDRPTEWKVSVPSSIAAEVELRLTDPLTGKPKYGARAELITQLLRDWLANKRIPQNS